jgi:hypothetical protein
MNSTRQVQSIDIDTILERYGDKAGFEAIANHVRRLYLSGKC